MHNKQEGAKNNAKTVAVFFLDFLLPLFILTYLLHGAESFLRSWSVLR